jgi:steroid delta-isomerase-like uncharacterized protein
MTEKDHVQLANQALAAINAHDIDGYLKLVDESYVGESETLGTVRGPAGARQMLTTMFQAFPDLHIKAEEIVTTGNHIISRSILSGTHKGTFAGVAPTNKKVTWHSCNFVEVKNGKAIRSRVYADNVSLLRQLGVLQVPKATTAG